jgi:hypothetical protein
MIYEIVLEMLLKLDPRKRENENNFLIKIFFSYIQIRSTH